MEYLEELFVFYGEHQGVHCTEIYCLVKQDPTRSRFFQKAHQWDRHSP